MSTRNFSSIYSRLNPAQKLAADTIDGPVMVIAGPGTGKTQILAARIANILKKTDTKPQNILALTFTESGAKNMRERVVSMIGRDGYYVQISTFHAFCDEVISSHPEYFPIDRASQALTDLERYHVFEKIIVQDKKLEVLKPLNRQLYYLKEVMSSIADLKREAVSPEDLDKLIKLAKSEVIELKKEKNNKTQVAIAEKNINKQQELSRIYHQYQKQLREMMRYDFEDMIALVVEAFETQELLLREYQENLYYFLVDEYQDTNSAQNRVVQLLASYWQDQANVFVVGDPHQSIYRFQGAAAENVVDFAKQYPNGEVITMTQGYRCPQTIYTAAHHLISENHTLKYEQRAKSLKKLKKSLAQELNAETKNELEKINVLTTPTQTLELANVAKQIKKLLKSGVSPEEIAVLYRHNADSLELADVLKAHDIDFEIDGGNNILESEVIRQLLNFLTIIYLQKTEIDDELLYEVLNYEWLGIDRLDVLKLSQLANRLGKPLFELISNGETNDSKSLEKLFVKLPIWLAADSNLVFTEWFEQVISESGFIDWLTKRDRSMQYVLQINALFRQIKALTGSNRGLKLGTFLEAIQTMIDHQIKIEAENVNAINGAVRLSTVHKAKGQEWDHVFVIHCIDGKWGNNRSRNLLPLPEGVLQNTDFSKQERNEDERRLFYVALTRAKKSVQLSYPKQINLESRSKEVIKTMFLEEIPDKYLSHQQALTSEDEAAQALEELLTLPSSHSKKVSRDEKVFFTELVKHFKLSVTALNNYLKDPRDFVLNNLLRLPKSKPEHMAFGTAVHVSLEKLYSHSMMTGEKLSLEELQKKYFKTLEREIINSQDFERRLKVGNELLELYHADFNPSTPVVYVERFFGSGKNHAILGSNNPIILTGRIDRVDWIDQKQKKVKVVDYKTGKAKSANDILGKTVSSNLSEREQSLPEEIKGPYMRQLLFYKLLAQLDPTFIPEVEAGEFEFVEPNKKTKKTTIRTFDLPDDQVELLKDLINEVMTEIRGLAFLDEFFQ